MQTRLDSLVNTTRKAKQVPAKSIKELNDKRISQLTPEEYKQVREDWDTHFNDNDFRDGQFKVVTGIDEEPLRFHDKADAIKEFYSNDNARVLMRRNKVLMTRDK